MMTVLHLGKFYPPARGGMETALELLCRGTEGRVHNRVLVASHAGPGIEEQWHGVQISRLPVVAKAGAVSLCPSLPVRLAAARPDLVVIHEPNPIGLVSYFAIRPDAPLIVWFHSEVVRPGLQYRLFYQPFLQFALSRAARIVVGSPALAETSPHLHRWRSKCTVIPYGIEMPVRSGEQGARTADAVSRPGVPATVLFVGRLVPYKGVDVLISAARELDVVVRIVGDGPERMRLSRAAATAGVAHRIEFLGEVSDAQLAALYETCDLFVLPSVTRQEAFGVVQIEAMMRGKPVISTRLGTGVDWVNQDGETGLVVPPGDAPALAGAIRTLLSNPARRAGMSRAAAQRARTVFSADRMIDATLDVYAQVLDAPHVRRKTVA